MDEPVRPTVREEAALTALGVVGEGLSAFLRGEAVVVYLDPPRESGIAVVQLTGTRLRCGVVEINDPGHGVELLMRFRGRCRTLAACCGANELEGFGAAIINAKLETILLRQGFEHALDDIPAALGGGQVEILTKVFPVEPETDL